MAISIEAPPQKEIVWLVVCVQSEIARPTASDRERQGKGMHCTPTERGEPHDIFDSLLETCGIAEGREGEIFYGTMNFAQTVLW